MILSIDASTTCIGWSVFNKDELIDCGRFVPNVNNLEWRDRIQNLIVQLQELIKSYKPTEMYIEDVPLMGKKGLLTLVQLGAVQGALLGVCISNKIESHFISVSNWRKNIGLFDGTEKGKERDEMKIKSIKKVNELFFLDLPIEYTRNGNYKPNGCDDISDSILIYCSTRDKYKKKNKSFGKG